MKPTTIGLLKWFAFPLVLLISILIGQVWWPFNYVVVVIIGGATVLWVLFLFIMGVRNMIKEAVLTKKNKKK